MLKERRRGRGNPRHAVVQEIRLSKPFWKSLFLSSILPYLRSIAALCERPTSDLGLIVREARYIVPAAAVSTLGPYLFGASLEICMLTGLLVTGCTSMWRQYKLIRCGEI